MFVSESNYTRFHTLNEPFSMAPRYAARALMLGLDSCASSPSLKRSKVRSGGVLYMRTCLMMIGGVPDGEAQSPGTLQASCAWSRAFLPLSARESLYFKPVDSSLPLWEGWTYVCRTGIVLTLSATTSTGSELDNDIKRRFALPVDQAKRYPTLTSI